MKYQKQITKLAHTDVTLIADAKLSPAKDDTPLQFYDDYSRFVLTIIDNETKKTLQAQVRPDEIYALKTKITLGYTQSVANKAGETTQLGVAYTKRIKILKNKTAAEVLLSGEMTVERLHQTYDNLKANLGKWPQNQADMDAINEAVMLYQKGGLKADAVACPDFMAYKSEYRYMTGRLKNEKGASIKTRNHYRMTLTRADGLNNPWRLEMENDHHALNARNEEAEKSIVRVQKCVYFSDDEMLSLADRLSRTMDWFETYHCMTQGKLYFQKFEEPGQ